jgi:hypothetical protein
MPRAARPTVVICLAMVLVVALISGMTALVCALVVPTWLVAALVVVSPERVSDSAAPLLSAPVRFSAGLRAPPPRP